LADGSSRGTIHENQILSRHRRFACGSRRDGFACYGAARSDLTPIQIRDDASDPNTPQFILDLIKLPTSLQECQIGTWKDVGKLPNFTQYGPWAPQLLTDGTVLVLAAGTAWFKLTPDSKGNYNRRQVEHDRRDAVRRLPAYFATQILTDGRMIVNGGEYNVCGSGESTAGSLYDRWPTAGLRSAPSGWSEIGDADSHHPA